MMEIGQSGHLFEEDAWHGRFFDKVMYGEILSSAKRQQVLNYYNERYSIF
jgi:hypothetical protein